MKTRQVDGEDGNEDGDEAATTGHDGDNEMVVATMQWWLETMAESKVLNIGYQDRIEWSFFISDIGYRGRYRGCTRISGIHIRHYIMKY